MAASGSPGLGKQPGGPRGDPPARAVTYLPRRLVMNSSHFKAAIARLPHLLAAPAEISHADMAADGWSCMAELQAAAV